MNRLVMAKNFKFMGLLEAYDVFEIVYKNQKFKTFQNFIEIYIYSRLNFIHDLEIIINFR